MGFLEKAVTGDWTSLLICFLGCWLLAAVESNRFTANWTSDDVCCNIATGTAKVWSSPRASCTLSRPLKRDTVDRLLGYEYSG